MLAEYFKERDGAETILTEGGFLAFKLIERQFYITEFYLDQVHRRSGKHFLALMRRAFTIAAENGCTDFSCHVRKSLPDFDKVLFLRLKFGFRIVTMDAEKLGMILPLQECTWAAAEE